MLEVTITDDGAGLPDDFSPGRSGLGTQIVQSLVQDLRGRIELGNSEAARDAGAVPGAASSVEPGLGLGSRAPGGALVLGGRVLRGRVSRRGGRGRCAA